MVQSLNIGVNGIITDKPDEFRQILESLGISILPPLAPSLSPLGEKGSRRRAIACLCRSSVFMQASLATARVRGVP